MNTAGMQKIALVTGAGSGIGRAVALAMQSAGYSVVAAGRRLAELEKTAAAASSSGNQILPVPTDVSKPDSVRALFVRIREAFGRLDVLFNNAGRSAPAVPMEDLPYEEWTAVVAVNLNGVGIELGRASCRRGVTSLTLSVARWVHLPALTTFPEAPQ